jgi:hypothetical protein
MNNAINTVSFYEGSYQFAQIQTELNITTDYVMYKLATQFEYRHTSKTLWAELDLNGEKVRYQLDYKNASLVTI